MTIKSHCLASLETFRFLPKFHYLTSKQSIESSESCPCVLPRVAGSIPAIRASNIIYWIKYHSSLPQTIQGVITTKYNEVAAIKQVGITFDVVSNHINIALSHPNKIWGYHDQTTFEVTEIPNGGNFTPGFPAWVKKRETERITNGKRKIRFSLEKAKKKKQHAETDRTSTHDMRG